jgi:hypothetical protein
MDGNVPCFDLFPEENQDWHLEDLYLIPKQRRYKVGITSKE